MRRAAVLAASVLVLVVAVLAVVDPFGSSADNAEPDAGADAPDDSPAEALSGPDVPSPGALPGRLVLSIGPECRPQTLRLETVRLGPLGPPGGCRLEAAPDGSAAVALASGDAAPTFEITVVRLSGRPVITDELGGGRLGVDWAPGGDLVAWCDGSGVTHVLTLTSGREVEVPGCDPRFTEDAALLTLGAGDQPLAIHRDGEAHITREEIAGAGSSAERRVVGIAGYDAGADGTVALLAFVQTDTELLQELQLWRAGRVLDTIRIAARPLDALGAVGDFGQAGRLVRLSPDGREVAVGSLRPSTRVTLIDLVTGRRTLLPEQRDIDWSPGGDWLAVATRDGVLILGGERSADVFRLPLDVASLSWIR